MAVCFVRWQEDGSVVIRTPYHGGFVAELKDSINHRQREWRPEEKVWWVDWAAADDAVAIVRDWFPNVQEILFARTVPPPPRRDDPAYVPLHLRETAPWPLIEGAYKILARLHHPDRGGDTTTMQGINRAYDDLKARHGK